MNVVKLFLELTLNANVMNVMSYAKHLTVHFCLQIPGVQLKESLVNEHLFIVTGGVPPGRTVLGVGSVFCDNDNYFRKVMI